MSEMCLAEVDPLSETKWGRDCDGEKGRKIGVVIVVKATGEEIYNRTASCGEWDDSNRTFVIEQQNGEFVVTGPGP